jgi:HAE1 family hydrophobic/amphiphilic exporter-1
MKKLAELAVRFRVTFLMIYIGVLAGGAFFGFRLKLDMWPDISFPMISVISTYTGAAPEDIEQLITRPIEEACAAVEGVKKINSESRDGASMLLIEFEWGTDLDQAETDLRRNLDWAREYLPADATEPLVFPFDPSMQPVMIFGVSGPFDMAKIREITKREIEPRLERAPGVASAEAFGGLEREIHVEVLPDRLAAAGISVNQVIGALRMENLQIPGGAIVHGDRELTIQTKGAFRSVDEIREVVVGVAGAVPVRLRDVARVNDTVAETNRIIRANQKPAVLLIVSKQSGANTVQAVEAIERALPELEKNLPRGIKLGKIFSQADFITESLGNLGTTGLLAIGMAVMVLLLFLRSLRASIIIGLAIPVSVLVTFSIMYAADLSLNIISMAGLALAVGMLVDNSIVVLENIYRHMEMGKEVDRAAVEGAGEVATAIFGSTLTTIAVFVPILFVTGIAGAMFRDMALTICISLGASFLVAITLIPLAAATLIRRGPKSAESLLARGYSKLQGGVLRRRLSRVAFFLVAWLVLLGSVVLINLVGTDFFPRQDDAMIFMQLKSQVGSSVEHTDRLAQRLEEQVLDEVPETALLMMDVGMDEGFTAMFSEGKHTGLMRLRLTPLTERDRRKLDIEDRIRELAATIPGLDLEIFQFGAMGGPDVTVKIVGHDLKTAFRVGTDIERLVSRVKGTKNVSFSLEQSKPEYRVRYDRKLISRLGLTTAEVSSTVSAFFQGQIASIYREGGEDHNIRVRAPRAYREQPNNLGNLTVVSPIAGSVPLRSLAAISEDGGPVKITRENQQRMVTVDASDDAGDMFGLIERIEAALDNYAWPDGFRAQIGGNAEDLIDSFQSMAFAMIVAMVLVFMVMASLFESLRTPFVIFFTIPLGMTGVGVALFLTDTVLSVVALIGVVILVGIVVNNSIVLVDHANQLRATGMNRVEAVKLAGRHRVRPILMTTLTTSLAMVPLALEIGSGAEAWSPLARVVIGGLLMATTITLFIVPIIYIWLGGKTTRASRISIATAPAALEGAPPASDA